MRSHYAVKAILGAYGADALDRCGTPARAAALAADIAELARDLAARGTDDYEAAYLDAAMLHARLVGGLLNLDPYLDSLHTFRC